MNGMGVAKVERLLQRGKGLSLSLKETTEMGVCMSS